MARLSLSLLGSFQATLDGKPVTAFGSVKGRALLVYLAVESDRPHRREVLATLLWPERPDREALSNLRYALSNLRHAIGDREATPPFLLITRETLQFNTASDHEIDVAAFEQHIAEGNWPMADSEWRMAEHDQPSAISHLQSAVRLYRGGFLEGFFVGDSPAFEEWALFKREQIGQQALFALHHLAAHHEGRGEYEQAQAYAWRQLELEPWYEEAYQQLMRALALSGQRSMALAQYETCRRVLAEELGVEPAQETTALYESIRDGVFPDKVTRRRGDKETVPIPPPFLVSPSPPPPVSPSPFVARERELARLGAHLKRVLAGRGRAVFVTGGAGQGKTALIQEFARRAQETYPHLIVAGGNCDAHTGIGDPYLPFREILGLLTGDVEARWMAGAITREHARRLWQALPLTTRALVRYGPDLIDTFVPGAALVARASAYARAATFAPGGGVWASAERSAEALDRLQELVERKAARPSPTNPQQSDLFQQYTKVLQALARERPLVLVLDDLQWADLGSISLLFHLGRRLAGSRILILGAYRPEEVAVGRGGGRHPLEPLVNEFQRDFGDIVVELGQARDREFVEAFLDSEPNRLGIEFRDMLYRQTGGHPLFTVELLRGMQGREDLVQDEAGRWIEGRALDWETLPARVEAAIAERVGRLPEALQATLAVASVEGEEFTAEVVARVLATDEQEMVQRLSGELEKQHRLVAARDSRRLGSQRLSRYRFRHYLFQTYLYNRLGAAERAYLHEDVGNVLEGLHGEETKEVAVQLARHFQEAGVTEKAVDYLRQAGERAARLSAYEEAVAHLTRGLGLLKTLPKAPERAQQELALQIALGPPLMATKGPASPEVEQVYGRARELCRKVEENPQLFEVLRGLYEFYHVRAELQTALELGEQLFSLAQGMQDVNLLLEAHFALGMTLLFMGELVPAQEHLEHLITLYDAQRHRSLAFVYGTDPGVFCRSASSLSLSLLGYPDQAVRREA